MLSFSCCSSAFKVLSRAAAKSAAARIRQMGIAGSIDPRWPVRAQVCERCPLRVVHRGSSYCGNPLLQKIHRDETIDGCGCPTIAKARSPEEHCPIDHSFSAAKRIGGRCSCKWCVSAPSSRSTVVQGQTA
jgi:hypothetical protein